MRGRTKLVSLATVITILLTSSMVFVSGIIDASNLPLNSVLMEPLSPGTPKVFVDGGQGNLVYPGCYYKDYALLPVGSKFTVHINISEATDLYTWQINITWTKSQLNLDVLSVSRIIPGEFLARSTAPTSSEELSGVVINATDNTIRTSLFTESLLTDVSGVTSATGGRLVSIEFLVVGYGKSDLIIEVTGSFPVALLSSTGASITFTTANGYFANKLLGDINGDRGVTGVDFGIFNKAFGTSSFEADLNKDGSVTGVDFGIFNKNFGRSV